MNTCIAQDVTLSSETYGEPYLTDYLGGEVVLQVPLKFPDTLSILSSKRFFHLYRNSNHFCIPQSAEPVFLQLKLPHYFLTKLFQLPHHISQHHDKLVKDIPAVQIE